METGERREGGAFDWGCTGAALGVGCSERSDTRSCLSMSCLSLPPTLVNNNNSQCQSLFVILITDP